MKNICQNCQGEGQYIIGENKVTLDMAIDAGDRDMAGMHHSYQYEPCEFCQGTGLQEDDLTEWS